MRSSRGTRAGSRSSWTVPCDAGSPRTPSRHSASWLPLRLRSSSGEAGGWPQAYCSQPGSPGRTWTARWRGHGESAGVGAGAAAARGTRIIAFGVGAALGARAMQSPARRAWGTWMVLAGADWAIGIRKVVRRWR